VLCLKGLSRSALRNSRSDLRYYSTLITCCTLLETASLGFLGAGTFAIIKQARGEHAKKS